MAQNLFFNCNFSGLGMNLDDDNRYDGRFYLFWSLPAYIGAGVPFARGTNNQGLLGIGGGTQTVVSLVATPNDMTASRARSSQSASSTVSYINAAAAAKQAGFSSLASMRASLANGSISGNQAQVQKYASMVDATPAWIYLAISPYPDTQYTDLSASSNLGTHQIAGKTLWFLGHARAGMTNPASLNFVSTPQCPSPIYWYTFSSTPVRTDPDYWTAGPLVGQVAYL